MIHPRDTFYDFYLFILFQELGLRESLVYFSVYTTVYLNLCHTILLQVVYRLILWGHDQGGFFVVKFVNKCVFLWKCSQFLRSTL